MDKKNQQSKSQFGTMTASKDANQDYTSAKQGGAMGGATSGMAGGAAGTMTSQAGQQKVKTSNKNIND